MSNPKLLASSRLRSSTSKSSHKTRTIIRNGELRSASRSLSKNNRSASKKSKRRCDRYVFADEKEEHKYRQYLKSVKMLNQMKQYLATMYKSASKDVIKRLVVAVQKME